MKTPQETARALTTHSASPAGVPDMDGWVHFARHAEAAGIDAVLMSFGCYEPDTLIMACALGRATEKLRFIAAYRSGLIQPPLFVQQINTLSGFMGGRIAINIVAGSSQAEQRGYGDFLAHDERYARTGEFLAICNALWQDNGPVDFEGDYYQIHGGQIMTPFQALARRAPEIFVAGHSQQAQRLAWTEGSCWLRLIDTLETLAPQATAARTQGVEMCLRLCVVCRPTREEARRAARALIPDKDIEQQERHILTTSDSKTLHDALAAADGVGWLNEHLWAGLVPYYGSSAMTLVGSPQDLADAFLAYKRIGITQFIISGWPKLDEMTIFGRDVLPLVREAERIMPTEDIL